MTSPHDPAPRPPDALRGDRPVHLPVAVADARPFDDRLRRLAAATQALAASPGIDDALGRVARLAVPAFGDWCLIDLVEDGEAARRVASAHADPEHTAAAGILARLVPDEPGIPCGVSPALLTGTSECTTAFGEAELARIRDPERRAVVRALGIRATIDAPLVVRGRVIGAITFLAAGPRHDFGEEDLALA